MADEPLLPDEFLEESSLTLEEYLALDPDLTEEQFRKAQEPLQEEVTLLEYISKNFTGPEGQPGEQGQRGYRGPKGVPGERGVDGRQGKTGQTGPMGLTGPEGAAGSAGANGTQGPQGVEGPQGPIGPRGNDGDKGDTGSPGQAGPQGTRGVDGREGPEGPRGLQGSEGSQGPEGPRGKDGRDGKDGGTPTIPADGPPEKSTMRRLGFKELEAAPGNHWHHMPESQHARRHGLRLGVDPIFPRDGTANGRVLAFNDGSPDYLEWVVQTGGGGTAAGPTGATGPQGPPGPPGPPGLDGDDGMMGPVGAIGPPGDTGPAGATGAQGIPGNDGAAGATGPAGTDGIIGSNGAPGLDGQDGQDGPPGPKGDKGDTGDTGATGAAGAAGATGATGAAGSTGSQGAPGIDGLDGQDGIPGADGTSPQFHDEMTTALAIRPDIHIMGKGLAVRDVSGRTEIVSGAYYDAIIDSNDTNAIGKGNVYSKIVDAITAGHKTIFVKSAIDTADISIASGDSVLRLIGDASLGTAIPVNVTCAKVGVAFEFLNFTSKRLKFTAARCIALGCFFTGTLTPGSVLVNRVAEATVNIVSSTNANPISIQATAHGYVTGDLITVVGHTVNTTAVGTWTITRTDANNFTLDGAKGTAVGGATGTVSRSGVGAADLSIAFDGGTNGGLLASGWASMEFESFGYVSGGTDTSGTLTVGHIGRRGQWESAPFSHPDNSVITDMTDGHMIIEADDCTVLTCQFVSCVGPLTHCVIQRTGVSRMRVVSSTFLANTTWSCIAMLPAYNSSTDYGRNTISACTFDTNVNTEAIIDVFQPNLASITGRASATAVGINGCLFRGFTGIAIRQWGLGWNISGNIFDSTAIHNSTHQINHAAGIDISQTFIPYDTSGGSGTLPLRTLALIDSEVVSMYVSANPYTHVGRGLCGTTAATHADNAVITYMNQIAIFVVAAPQLSQVVSVAGGNIYQNIRWNTYCQEKDHPASASLNFATRLTVSTSVFAQGSGNNNRAGLSWSFLSNSGNTSIDCRSKTSIAIIGHIGAVIITNLASDTFILLGNGSPTGPAFANMLPTGTVYTFGRIAGDTAQLGLPVTNRTAATSVVGNVCIYDVANNSSVVNAGIVARSTIVAGVLLNAVANLADAIIAETGVVTVNCDTGAVVVGGRLGTSLITAGLASTIAVPTLGQTFAVAETAKAAGANGSVKARMRYL